MEAANNVASEESLKSHALGELFIGKKCFHVV
jgi:hypothetical protein